MSSTIRDFQVFGVKTFDNWVRLLAFPNDVGLGDVY